MSKTTLRKRISLVAVTALTAGLLSVVASPAANANIAANTPASQATFTNDSLNVAVIASTTGAAISNGTTANLNKSLGLIYKDASSTTAQSATMLATGALALYTLVSATNIGITATGGAFSSPANSGAATEIPAIAASLKGVLTNATATNVAVVWTPGAVGTYVISMYEGNTVTYPDSSLGLARGDLKSQITVTVVASGVAGAYASTYTLCNVGSSGGSAAATDVSGASAINNGGTGFIHFNLKDAYNTQLATASASALTASTTGSAVLDIAASAAGAIAASDVVTSTTSGTVAIKQATAGVPTTATVTLSYGGTVVCTKTLTFQGEVASLKAKAVRAQTTVSASVINKDADRASLDGGTIEVEAFDSAGNKVNPLAANGDPAATTQFGTVASTVSSTTVSSITFGTVATGVAATSADALWPVSSTLAYHSCAGRGTNDKLQVTFQNPSGTIITSPAFSARCAAAAVSYKASWDKASYVQGDIAKLTVTWFDQYGNPAPSSGITNQGTVTGATPTITAPMMTLVGTLTNNHGVDVNGSKVWTYTVGTSGTFTEGSYQGLVDYSALSGTTGAIQTVAYKVALTGTPGVSNADVLKSIVALIASINKQIQALQKLILKRR